MYYERRYFQTKPEGGYTAPNFAKIAEAHGINAYHVDMERVCEHQWSEGSELLELMIREDTYVTPKLEFGKPNQDQEPLIDRMLYGRIMNMQIVDRKSARGGYWLSNNYHSRFTCLPSVREERRWAA